ncbi:DUF4915 domain-containing protein [Microseira sp. BLCC-F43]|jgi:hypothetical protein|uniref:DUF4915 domain-containing protein n=1 Tax=Microseira sp. BLCC-F43 TaxID=3153602 RepID=UPI0035B7AF7F
MRSSLFVSSLLNCLATVSERYSCTPLWKPPFISKIINEDRFEEDTPDKETLLTRGNPTDKSGGFKQGRISFLSTDKSGGK